MERNERLKQQREQEREEYKDRKNQERKVESDQESEEEVQKAEPITLLITETRTRSDKVEVKQVQEKAKDSSEKKQQTYVDRKNVPPGPGQYLLPSDVSNLL